MDTHAMKIKYIIKKIAHISMTSKLIDLGTMFSQKSGLVAV